MSYVKGLYRGNGKQIGTTIDSVGRRVLTPYCFNPKPLFGDELLSILGLPRDHEDWT